MISEAQYNEYKAEYAAALAGETQFDNEHTSAIEVYKFMQDKPQSYFLYIDEQTRQATTWTGAKLGSVVFLREYRSTFGDTRVSIRVKGINGIVYYGTYYKSAGDYARIKAYK